MSDLALICASCPEAKHDVVASICQAHKIQKAYGRTGDMVDSLAGKDWVAKWQAKVVMAAVTLASSMSVKRVKLICIQGGRFCNEEYKQTQVLKAAVEREWRDGKNEGKILVDVHWTEFEAFVADYPLVREKAKSEASVKGKSARSPDETSNGTKHSAVPAAAPAPAPSRNGKTNPPIAPTPTTTKSNRGPIKDIRSGDRSAIAEQKAPPPTPHHQRAPEVPTYACDECGKDFKSMEKLTQHLASTNHFEIKLKCKGCEKAFADKLRLKQHQGSTGHFGEQKLKVRQRDIAAEDDVWTCGECEKEFKSELALENHQQATGHIDPECPVCEKVFNCFASLEQHLIATQHGAICLQFQNGEISRTEAREQLRAANAAAHRPARTDRSTPAQHACPVCNAQFKSHLDQALHMMFSGHIFLSGNARTGYFLDYPGYTISMSPQQDDAINLLAIPVKKLLSGCDAINFDVSGCCEKEEIIQALKAAKSGAPRLTPEQQLEGRAAAHNRPKDNPYWLTPLTELSRMCRNRSIDTRVMMMRQDLIAALVEHDRIEVERCALLAGADGKLSADAAGAAASADEIPQADVLGEGAAPHADFEASVDNVSQAAEVVGEGIPTSLGAAPQADLETSVDEVSQAVEVVGDGIPTSLDAAPQADVETSADEVSQAVEAGDGSPTSLSAAPQADVGTSVGEAPHQGEVTERVDATLQGDVEALRGSMAVSAISAVRNTKLPNTVVLTAPAQTVVDGPCTCMFSRMSPHRMSKCTIGGGKGKTK